MIATAKDLIIRSISRNEIAHGVSIDTVFDDLMAECEDWVQNGDVVEFWGVDDDGNKWRVHLNDC